MSEYLGFQPVSEEYINSGKEFYFISYNSQDINYIMPIVLKLHEMGVPLWYDYGIPYNSKWTGVIVDKIKKCRAVLFFLTWGIITKVGPNGDDPYTMKEYKIAKAAKKEIFVNAIDQINLIDEFGKIPDDKVEFILDIEDRQSIPIFKNSENLDWISSEICRAINITPSNDNWFNWDSSFQIKNGTFQRLLSTDKKIIIPHSATSIGEYAFFRYKDITNVIIPANVTSIENFAFGECENLNEVVISNSVTCIGDSAFENCKKLTNIKIPTSVTSIGNRAFSFCTNLTNIEIPNGVTSIGEDAFYGCDNLKEVFYTGTEEQWDNLNVDMLPNTKIHYLSIVSSSFLIEKNVLQRFIGIETDVLIPDNVTTVGEVAFKECNNLQSIVISNSVTDIGNQAFSNCKNLRKIIIPDSVTNMGTWVFSDCDNLTDVTISKNLNSIENGTFIGCKNLTNIIIPNNISKIGFHAFAYCESLKKVTISSTAITIGGGAFAFCRNLTNINIPNSVINIENCAFYCCESLSSIIIPNNVTNIGDSAFEKCKNLINITISNSVTIIGNHAFSDCNNLKEIFYNGAREQWEKLDVQIPHTVKIHFVF